MIKINAAARLLASKPAPVGYIIRKVKTDKMVEAYEGDDGKVRADELVENHNRHYPNDQWYVDESHD